MANYLVENQWGGDSAPWHNGGTYVLGARPGQNVVAIDITSADNGHTLTGTMTYAGEGPIGFKATNVKGNTYTVENQWGGSSAPWHPGGTWVIGARADQRVVQLKADSTNNSGGKNLGGTMTYVGEGPIGFLAQLLNLEVENQWGGDSAPWHNGGEWLLGSRADQNLVATNINSSDGGQTFTGDITYAGEGPIGFKATRIAQNVYHTENQWGGDSAPWHDSGYWVIGARDNQNAISVEVSSNDGGANLGGYMTYVNEGHIGFKGVLKGAAVPA